MSADQPGQPDRPPTATVLAALRVRRNAAIGFAFGVALALALYVFFVAIPGGTEENPLFYLPLAFVVATSVGAVLTLVLTVATAISLSRTLEARDDPFESP